MGKTVFVDCTNPFGNDTPQWPSPAKDFFIERVCNMPRDHRLTNYLNGFCMHVGTHVDAPAHCLPETEYVDEIPLEKFYGTGVVLGLPQPKWGVITVDDLKNAKPEIQDGDIVLINTGSHNRWGENDDYFMYSNGLTEEAAQWLCEEKHIKLFGIDTQSLDHPCNTYMIDHPNGPTCPRLIEEYTAEYGHPPKEDFPKWEPCHDMFLSHGVPGIENVGGDLDMVTGRRCTIIAFPLRFYKGDASCVRVVAMIDEDDLVPGVEKKVYKYGVY